MRYTLLAASVLALAAPRGVTAHQPQERAFISIPGSVPLAVREGHAARLAALQDGHPLSLALSLASRDQQGLDRALAAVNDSGSSLYRHYFTPAQFNARFGPDPVAVRRLSAWLRAQGLRVQPWAGGSILDVRATAASAAAAFHTSISTYRIGRTIRFAADREPLLPASLASGVKAIVGLSQQSTPVNLARFHAVSAHRAGDGPGGGFDPNQIATAYDFSPIYAAGYHGEGMRTAFIELAPYSQSDLTVYAQQYGLHPTVNFIRVDGGSGQVLSAEATLDADLLASAAPSALIDIYDAPITNSGLLDAYRAVAAAGNANVLSVEWATCEPIALLDSSYITAQHQVLKQLLMQGTTVVVASGDSGAYSCGDFAGLTGIPADLPTRAAVSYPAGDPYVLAVGGTTLQLNTTNDVSSISFERAWSCLPSAGCTERGPNGEGTGGGLSTIFTRGDIYGDDLSWQAGPGVANSYSNGSRQVPDVAASADVKHGYSFYFDNHWYMGGGTSASAPIWSALILLTDQYLIKQGLKPLGWVNPLVYQLGANPLPYPPYHDVIAGDNLLYPATSGWDFATGWGSPDAWNFVRDAASGAVPPTPTVVVPPPAPPAATSTPTPIPPTATQPAIATATATSTTPATSTPSPTATPTPACPATGVGNGQFANGTLICWRAGGNPRPQVSTAMRFKGHDSVQLGGHPTGKVAPSTLSQTVSVPTGLARPVLHLSYWLDRGPAQPAATPPATPVLTIADTHGHIITRLAFLPHRQRAWSGLAVPLPLGQPRLLLTLGLPPGRVLLYVAAISIGS